MEIYLDHDGSYTAGDVLKGSIGISKALLRGIHKKLRKSAANDAEEGSSSSSSSSSSRMISLDFIGQEYAAVDTGSSYDYRRMMLGMDRGQNVRKSSPGATFVFHQQSLELPIPTLLSLPTLLSSSERTSMSSSDTVTTATETTFEAEGECSESSDGTFLEVESERETNISNDSDDRDVTHRTTAPIRRKSSSSKTLYLPFEIKLPLTLPGNVRFVPPVKRSSFTRQHRSYNNIRLNKSDHINYNHYDNNNNNNIPSNTVPSQCEVKYELRASWKDYYLEEWKEVSINPARLADVDVTEQLPALQVGESFAIPTSYFGGWDDKPERNFRLQFSVWQSMGADAQPILLHPGQRLAIDIMDHENKLPHGWHNNVYAVLRQRITWRTPQGIREEGDKSWKFSTSSLSSSSSFSMHNSTRSILSMGGDFSIDSRMNHGNNPAMDERRNEGDDENDDSNNDFDLSASFSSLIDESPSSSARLIVNVPTNNDSFHCSYVGRYIQISHNIIIYVKHGDGTSRKVATTKVMDVRIVPKQTINEEKEQQQYGTGTNDIIMNHGTILTI